MTEGRNPGLPDATLRLLQFGDLHLCGDESGRVRDVATCATFERWLDLHPDGRIDSDIVWLPRE